MKRSGTRNALPTEHQEQVALIQWRDRLLPLVPSLGLLFAIPNGGKRSIVTAKKLKAEGVLAGIPDLLLPIERQGKGPWASMLWIEMKRSKGGVVSKDQELMHRSLRDQGHSVVVCRGWVEAARAIVAHLDMPSHLAP